jgi:hypothetical protein
LVVSAIIGVLTALFQITAVITVTPVFLWVVFGIAVVYLAVLPLAGILGRGRQCDSCICAALEAVLAGILGAILVSVILLAVGIVATSVLSAILVGLLLFFFSLTLTGTACYVRCLNDCNE